MLQDITADDNWYNRLPWVLLGLRTAPKEDLLLIRQNLLMGRHLGYLHCKKKIIQLKIFFYPADFYVFSLVNLKC